MPTGFQIIVIFANIIVVVGYVLSAMLICVAYGILRRKEAHSKKNMVIASGLSLFVQFAVIAYLWVNAQYRSQLVMEANTASVLVMVALLVLAILYFGFVKKYPQTVATELGSDHPTILE